MPSLPSQPGVYWFSDADDKVLYVGKAKNIKNRVRSYTQLKQLLPRIKQLSSVAATLKFKILDSELEALLTEAELIRTYQPPFNVALKDDKSPLYILITDELYPRVLQSRKKEVQTQDVKATVLGPFPSAYKVVEVLKLVRPIFPWCNQTGNLDPRSQPGMLRGCFYHHLELCPGACVGAVTPEVYAQTINQLTQFLRGSKKTVVTELKTKLAEAVTEQQFELAAQLRDRVHLIESVTNPKTRLKPTLTLSTPGLTQNTETDGLMYLRRILVDYCHLPKDYPLERIEGYDVSNTSGTNASVAMVVFEQGTPASSEYRLFNIRSLDTPNDYHMLKEALLRRQNHPEWGWPQLVVIDGGRGQVKAALNAWQDSTPIIGLVKNPDRIVIPSLHLRSKINRNFSYIINKTSDVLVPRNYHVLTLPETHPALQLLQRIRNESHRFSKKQHSRRRTKAMFQ